MRAMPYPDDVLSNAARLVGAVVGSVGVFSLLVVINVFQMLSLLVYPFSPKAFRWFNRGCADFFWSVCVFWVEKVCRTKPRFYGDQIPKKENAIVICNHQSVVDIFALMSLAIRKRRLGDLKWVVKDIIKYFPGPGWGMLFLGCIYVKRDWGEDAKIIEISFSHIHRNQTPLWLISFPEGTRIRPHKLAAAQKYARRIQSFEPSRVLIPRVKGFSAALKGLGEHVDAVYDVTIGFGRGTPSFLQMMMGWVPDYHLKVKRFPVGALPKTQAAQLNWLLERYELKDKDLCYLEKHGTFPHQESESESKKPVWVPGISRPENSPSQVDLKPLAME